MRASTWLAAAALLAAGMWGERARGDDPVDPAAVEFFEKEIRPLLAANCQACHGPQKSQGGLRLTSRELFLAGGDSGAAVVPGKPGESLLIRAVGYVGDLKMPPKQKLADADIAKLTRWVELGAPWPASDGVLVQKHGFEITPEQRRWWSLQPLAEVAPPAVTAEASVRNEIDRFVLAKLEAEGLQFSAAADPRTLLRRATYDLTGLPPTPEELDSFLADASPDAFARTVDRLLESPQYGVHWGRHWLDVARYGDTRWVGAGEDKRWPFAYTYRDWVVQALNEDVAYDRFVTLQLAADQTPDARPADQAALGFLTVGRWFTGVMPDVIDDQIDVVTRGLMGLTVQCARCHDHKYDPLATSDYYSLYGLFAAARMPVDGSGILSTLPEIEPRPVEASVQQEIAALRGRVDAFLQERLTRVRATYRPPEKMREYLLAATSLIGKKDDDVRAYAQEHSLQQSILFRWFRLLQRTAHNSHRIFGPFHAFAAIPEADFAAKAAGVAETELANTKTNPHVLKILTPPPTSMTEVVDRYLALLRNYDVSEKFNNYDEESLREVLTNNDSPVLVPLRELGEHLAPVEMDQLVQLRRALLARQAQLSERADLFLTYDREAATLAADINGYIEKRQAELTTELRSPKKIADGLLATRDAEGADETRRKSIVKARGLSDLLLDRWVEYQKANAERDDPVFAVWRGLAAIPDADFAAQAPDVLAKLRETPANKLIVEAFAAPPATLPDAATRYAELLVRHQPGGSAGDSDQEQLRDVWRAADSPLAFGPDDVFDYFTRRDADEVRNRERNLARVYLESPGAPARAMTLRESGRSYAQKIFVRGNPNQAGDAAHGRFLTVLQTPQSEPFPKGQGRLALARQIVDPANPLTARVLVNRVWQWHFGAGLVRTPSDFGLRGAQPTHPELLDWLTQQFIADGWSLKKLHRRILLSTAWRQASADQPAAHARDPENRLLWRMNRRRLTFEELRDALLASAGRLDAALNGRPIDLTLASARRRTLFGAVDRITLPGFYRSFDFPSPEAHVSERFETIVPQQALYLMNNTFTLDQAASLARRTASHTAPSDRIVALYRLALGRGPDADELALGERFVAAELAADSEPKPAVPATAPPAAPTAAPPDPWRYGYGAFDESTGRISRFEPFPFFNGQWRGGPQDHDPVIGRCSLNSHGGTAGRDGSTAAIRRWIAPRAGRLAIAGKLSVQPNSTEPSGDGVRGRIVSSRHGLLGTWLAHGTEEPTAAADLEVQAGDAMDFVSDGRGRDQAAGFQWTVVLTMTAPDAAADEKLKWEADREFKGAPVASPRDDVWARYAQVLLESNEFLMLD